jgi:GNAT superfamily N-acetyltransferase
MMALQRSTEEEDAVWGYSADSAEQWANRNLAWTLVGILHGKPVGFICCLPRPYSGECVFPAGSRILEILELHVAAGYRSQGLGSKLVAAIQRQAEQDGFTHLRVYSAARRFDDIVRFYRSCGFTPWCLEMTMKIEAEPRIDGQSR